MKKNDTINWLEFLIQTTEDKRLITWHILILIAIIKLAYLQNEEHIIRVSRSKIMHYGNIKTIPTYHKYFKELQNFGYIKYTPSYHPDYRSTIELLIPQNPTAEMNN
ncbi:hypothetical protein [Chryseobacterium viscerum]|uniref:Uncharacterized protein n=1 Tax=Chryseobacterium viscerum TaxID=1037377 RepID=A0A316WDA6_9FLAO|nr:hypothetical protein [Chryseobacterium viscerum]PWN58006.1 hypothetical protein C1634_025035 [Chryseobacterium viscerum]